MTRIALIHALTHSVAPINEALERDWPAATRMNLIDDSLSADLARGGRGLDEAMHERSFGLWRADGSAKPGVGVVGVFAGATRSALSDDGWIDIDADRYWRRPGVELPRLYGRFKETRLGTA